MKNPIKDQETLEEVCGNIEKLFYSSSKFCTGILRSKENKAVKFAGNIFVKENENVILRGKWIVHPKYGKQFKANSLEYNMVLDEKGLAYYLANNPDFVGVGKVKASIIAWKFCDCFEDVLEKAPEKIAEESKVSIETVNVIRNTWQKNKVLNSALTWLASFELTHNQVVTLVDKYGQNIVGILKSNPYAIIKEIPRLGFRRVDDIALKIGVSKDNENRVQAGIFYCVGQALENGNCWVEYQELLRQSNKLLTMDTLDSFTVIEKQLRVMLDGETLDSSEHHGMLFVAKASILKMERELYEEFLKARNPNPKIKNKELLEDLITTLGSKLNEGQTKAVRMALTNTVSVITGEAGSGKSFLLKTIVDICTSLRLHVELAAPTGKAAKRMEQSVRGSVAKTIHRLLGYNGAAFGHGPNNPLRTHVVLVDEASMIDVPLAWQLLSAIDLNNTCVVFIGDHNQLPPVGPGNVLRDLIQTNVVPKVVLDTVVRQAGELKDNSTAILRGKVAKTSETDMHGNKPWILLNKFPEAQDAQNFLLEMFDEIIEDKLKYDLVKDVQVLTPTHKGPLGTKELNIKLQSLLQLKLWQRTIPIVEGDSRPKFYKNDKVIQTRNNYDLNVMNGAIGYVARVESNGDLVVDFEGDKRVKIEKGSENASDIQLAYALTIHRCQGSEYPCAVVIMHKAHTFMHHQNLFYTGVTRAKQTAIILGDHFGVSNCATTRKVDKRDTFLSYFLAESQEALASGFGHIVHEDTIDIESEVLCQN